MQHTVISPAPLRQWAAGCLSDQHAVELLDFVPLRGDASCRRYFRALTTGDSFIAALAPSDQVNNTGYVAVARLLHAAGVPAPKVLSTDLQRGFLLLSDLHDELLLHHLDAANVDKYYALALAELLKIQQIHATTAMPLYGGKELLIELARFQEWFVTGLLDVRLERKEVDLIASTQQIIAASADAQPQIFVHRDFQSRNLMPQKNGELAVIDFQDAALGPLTYDAASLLRDTHIDWPEQQVRGWALDYAAGARRAGLLPDYDEQTFLRWFDLNSMERNITVLGTFSRLHLRDGKPDYLQHLPRLIRYIFTIGANYPEFTPFLSWFKTRLLPVIERQNWYRQRVT